MACHDGEQRVGEGLSALPTEGMIRVPCRLTLGIQHPAYSVRSCRLVRFKDFWRR
jgi:hypothetical protein